MILSIVVTRHEGSADSNQVPDQKKETCTFPLFEQKVSLLHLKPNKSEIGEK